jgi:hypothetical protein
MSSMAQLADTKPAVIVALMIGELIHQPVLNSISTSIVHAGVDLWRGYPDSILICESSPMTRVAVELGVPSQKLLTAIPDSGGHTTRRVAEWLRLTDVGTRGPRWVVTHRLHSRRASKIFARCGLSGRFIGLDLPFSRLDRDWKLRSTLHFLIYDVGAELYCRWKGWL